MAYKTDKEYINRQYGSDKNLNRRIQIHKYSTNPVGWADWLFSRYDIAEGSSILEIGCGNALQWRGRYQNLPPGCLLLLSDVSRGMIDSARKNAGQYGKVFFAVSDAGRIPHADASFDIVIANHMLYHVRNIQNTLREIHRVLKEQGKLFASTVGEHHMSRFHNWIQSHQIPVDFKPQKIAKRFGVENGETILSQFFTQTKRHMYEDDLRVPSIDPILEYFASFEKKSAESQVSESWRDSLADELNRELREKGAIHIHKSTGAFESNKISETQ